MLRQRLPLALMGGFATLAVGLSAPVLNQAPPDTALQIKARAAVKRSIPLLQSSAQTWLERSTCTSCHHQALGSIAIKLANSNGFHVDQARQSYLIRESIRRRAKVVPMMYELAGAINGTSGHGYLGLIYAANRLPPDDFTDAAGYFLLGSQSADGSWPSLVHRPPLEDSPFTLTAVSVRTLRTYPAPGRRAETQQAIERAMTWLLRTQPKTNEERTMRLLGSFWAGAPAARLSPLRQEILRNQQPDGGWKQVDGLGSDAYATGQSLMALRVAGGLAISSAAYRRGVEFLVNDQKRDGSWHVKTRRVVEGLPYFETGYPYGVDQFISYAGAAWATMALATFATDGSTDELSPLSAPKGSSKRSLIAADPQDEPLFRAVANGSAAEVSRLLQQGARANARSKSGATPLMLAARDPEIVKVLLKAGADPNAITAEHSTALMIAAAHPHGLESMRLLLEAGADPNEGRSPFDFPLSVATMAQDFEKVKLLLASKVSFKSDNVYALSLAETTGNLKMIEFLVKAGIDVNLKDPAFGSSPLLFAVTDRNPDVVELLLRLGADPNTIDGNGWSPLQIAAQNDPSDTRIIQMLLKAGADVGYKTKDKSTALEYARKRGFKAAVALLEEASRVGARS